MLRDFVNPAQPSVALADLANVIRPIDENMKYKLRMVINFDMMDSAGTRLGNPLLPDVLADFRFLFSVPAEIYLIHCKKYILSYLS